MKKEKTFFTLEFWHLEHLSRGQTVDGGTEQGRALDNEASVGWDKERLMIEVHNYGIFFHHRIKV